MVDLWERVPVAGLPADFAEALATLDHDRLKELLTSGQIPAGVYGRQIVQLRGALPLDDPIFAQHRGWSALSYGDWDDLQRCVDAGPVDPHELLSLRAIILAPLDRSHVGEAHTYASAILEAWDCKLSQSQGRFRRFARRTLALPVDTGGRPDVAQARHVRFRRLQDVLILAKQEAIGGRLEVAEGLAREAQRLGDEGDYFRPFARDLERLVRLARGEDERSALEFMGRLREPRGPAPLIAIAWLLDLAHLLALRADGSLAEVAALVNTIAIRLCSPRFEIQTEAWRIAAELHAGNTASVRDLPGLRVQSGGTSPGLRSLPEFLSAWAGEDPDGFELSAQLARASGQLWLQLSALAWLAALRPRPRDLRRLCLFLEASGWRRLPFVSRDIAARAAIALVEGGHRSRAIVELASASGRPKVALAVAETHATDTRAPLGARRAAVEVLHLIGVGRGRAALRDIAHGGDEIARLATDHLSDGHGTTGLSEREMEVVDLAGRGLTNREIGERLSLSRHTVARHLANACAKLGAENRAEAAVRVAAMRGR
ncbi:MAG: helix-turn-helix transcriptional regulator [Chloroflexi bacterium]|nr:MAG: helix-turn-helix transcriptional regulator [Chloroflexota bacterium]